MSYGLTIESDYGTFDLAENWVGVVEIDYISYVVKQGSSYSDETYDYSSALTENAKLFVANRDGPFLDGRTSSLYSQGELYSSEITIDQEAKTVRLSQSLYANGTRSDQYLGDTVGFSVFAYYDSDDDLVGDYGLSLPNSAGIGAFLTNVNSPLYVVSGCFTESMGTARETIFNSGLSTDDYPSTPIVFAADSEYNGIYIQPYASDGVWMFRVWRYKTYTSSSGFQPSSSVVRMVAFNAYQGTPSGYGLQLNGSDGTVLFASPAAPLIVRKMATYGDYSLVVGTTFTEDELAETPMYLTAAFGLQGTGTNNYPWGTRLLSTGEFTSCRFDNYYYSGSNAGYWGGNLGGTPCPIIYGSDYFDDL